MKIYYIRPYFLNNSDSFKTQDLAIRPSGNVLFLNVKVSTAESSHHDPNNNIRSFLNFRFRLYLPSPYPRAMVNKSMYAFSAISRFFMAFPLH